MAIAWKKDGIASGQCRYVSIVIKICLREMQIKRIVTEDCVSITYQAG